MKMIPVSRGKYFALVDDEDYEWLMQWKWFYSGNGYAVRKPRARQGECPKGTYSNGNSDAKVKLMHREILKTPEGFVTDHINGNTLDNRKSNLRACTDAQNTRNQKTRHKSVSGYKGVTWNKPLGKWQAAICVDRKQIHLGFYDSKDVAAVIYNEAAIKHHGSFARLNNVNAGAETQLRLGF